nr:MAG TPA: hypothetical protein [Caudoviricetes sp.]
MLMLIFYYLVSSLSILLNNLCNYAMIIICYFDDVKSCDPLYIFDIITTSCECQQLIVKISFFIFFD